MWRGSSIALAALFVACVTPVKFTDDEDENTDKTKTDDGKSPANGQRDGGRDAPGDADVAPTPDGGPGSMLDANAPDVFVPPDPTPCVEDRTLVGMSSQTTLASDNVVATEVNAFSYVATANGSGRCARVYLAVVGSAAVRVGVYADKAGVPDGLLAQGSIATPVVGWNKAVLGASVPFTTGARVWLAVVPASGEVDIKVKKDCTGRRIHLNANGGLPSSFTPDAINTFCDAAFYLSP